MMNGGAVQSGGSLSLRGGALVLKSISLFLAGGRRSKSPTSSKKPKGKSKSKRMQEGRDAKNKITPKLLESLKKETHFSKMEIESLYRIYKQLISMDRNKPQLDKSAATSGAVMRKPTFQEGVNRNVFCELLHNSFDIVTEEILMDRIFTVWDIENAGVLTPKAWFHGLSVFLKGTLLEQLEFCFSIYDLNSDGFITKEEMFILLKNCLISHPQDEDPDEGVKELVEIVLKKMDLDSDGKVSLEDFRESVIKEPLLLQAFGPCLPSKNASETFLTTLRI